MLPLSVSSALQNIGSDAIVLAAIVLLATVSIYSVKFLRKAIHGGGDGSDISPEAWAASLGPPPSQRDGFDWAESDKQYSASMSLGRDEELDSEFQAEFGDQIRQRQVEKQSFESLSDHDDEWQKMVRESNEKYDRTGSY